MIRDFSPTALDELLVQINALSESNVVGTRWKGELWSGFTSIINKLSATTYADAVQRYYTVFPGKCYVYSNQLKNMFAEVQNIDQSYAVRLAFCLSRLEGYNQLLETLCDAISFGGVTADSHLALQKRFAEALDSYLKDNELLIKGAKDGITADDIRDMDPLVLDRTLRRFASTFAALMPSVSLFTPNFEIPIGPDLVFYYRTAINTPGGLDGISVGAGVLPILQQHRLILSSLSSSYGDVSITTGTGPTGKESIVLYNDGNVKLTLTYFISLLEAGAELSATSRVSAPGAPAASVTSTIGFKMKTEENNNFQWVPISDPVLQEVPVPVPVPSLVNQESKPTIWNFVKNTFDDFLEARKEVNQMVLQADAKVIDWIHDFLNAPMSSFPLGGVSDQKGLLGGFKTGGFSSKPILPPFPFPVPFPLPIP